ncbi:hypothetical protein [Streptomyces sp. NPDC088196]|uniref:hypothetical protein n=1 Tax=Streptomyces sp. NPDC088196 TaxID=3154868 RepID=UPI00344BC06A
MARPPALPDGIPVGAAAAVPAPAPASVVAVPVGHAAVFALGLDVPPAELVPPDEQATRASPAVMATVTAAPALRRPARDFP